jgi:hypothetical protein
MPDVVRRAGLDLNPFEVSDAAQAGWLEALVWPEQTVRLANLRAAIKLAAAFKPPVARGDLRHDLTPLIHEALKEAALVIFHTAVLAYVPSVADRGGLCTKGQDHLPLLDLERGSSDISRDSATGSQAWRKR